MKIIGIIGGLSPESTVKYYQWLNEGVKYRKGGHNGARILLSSVNGQDIGDFRDNSDYEGQGRYLAAEAKRLQDAGADCILLASNTSHMSAAYIEEAVTIPFLHLADMTAKRIVQAGIEKIGLIATKPTMEKDFYKSRLLNRGLNVVIPATKSRSRINEIIYKELCHGIVKPESQKFMSGILDEFAAQNIKGVILGCTELTLLDLSVPDDVTLFDTTKIHVEAALEFLVQETPKFASTNNVLTNDP